MSTTTTDQDQDQSLVAWIRTTALLGVGGQSHSISDADWWNLRVVEIAVFALIFAWLVLLIRNISASRSDEGAGS